MQAALFDATLSCCNRAACFNLHQVPDQITVLNKYQTTASTDVYQNEEEKNLAIAAHANMAYGEFSMAVKGGFSQKEDTQQHTADRKIDVKLYTLYVENVDTKGAEAIDRNSGLEPEFVMDASQLPTRFGDDAHACLGFLRKWGR